MDPSLKFKIAISFIPGVGSVIAKRLISYTGDIEAIFKEKKHNLLKIPGIGDFIAEKISHSDALIKAEKEMEFIERNRISVVFYLDDAYPCKLKQCADAPVVLYVKGSGSLHAEKCISVVGTRKPSSLGIDNCIRIINDLAVRHPGLLVVSGLAFGVDITAHKAAMKAGLSTIAVLGHGLQMIYPAAHKKVAEDMCLQGALLSEFPSQCVFDRSNFVKRNRIIAGMTEATLVIESGERGGALITAELANAYNKDVFALPGRTTDTVSKGCNKLIKSNKAALVEEAADIEYLLGWDNVHNQKENRQLEMFVELNEREKQLVDLLQEEKMSIDVICSRMQQPPSVVFPLLLNLEFAGIVKSMPGKQYMLCR